MKKDTSSNTLGKIFSCHFRSVALCAGSHHTDRLCSHRNKWPFWWPFILVKQYYKFSEVPITHGSFFLTLFQCEVAVGTFSCYFLKTHNFHDFSFTCFMKPEYWCVGFNRHPPPKVFYSLSLSTPITKMGGNRLFPPWDSVGIGCLYVY